MADEIDLDLNQDDSDENIKNNKVEKRIKDLSEKVKNTAQERDDTVKAKAEAEARALNAEKERDFYSSFTDSTAKYPGAIEFKDKIKEKVMAGYDVEDATISILAREGKLTNAPSKRESPAGGSATNALKDGGEKSLNEMTRDEKRAKLMEADLSLH